MEPKRAVLQFGPIVPYPEGRVRRRRAMAALRAPSFRSFVVVVAAVFCVGPTSALVGGGTPANAAAAATAVAPALGLVNVPGTKGGLSGVSCYGKASCIAVGTKSGEGFVVAIRDGVPGAVKLVSGTTGLSSVSCPSASLCWAAGTTIYRNPPEPMAIVGAIVQIDNGVPEGVSDVIGIGMPGAPDGTSLNGISCSDTTFCMAAGDDTYLGAVVVPITNGEPGSLATAGIPGSMSGVECETYNWCIADGQNANGGGSPFGEAVSFQGTSLNPGPSWGDPSIGNLVAGACREKVISFCITAGTDAAGSEGVVFPIVSRSAGTVKDIPHTTGLNGVACGGSSYCVAVGQNSSGEGSLVEVLGETPEAARAVSGSKELSSVACAGAKFCIAVGSNSSSNGVAYMFSLPS